MVPRPLSRSNLADPDNNLGSVICFILFQALFFCILTNGPTLACLYVSWLLFTVGPMSPRQLSMPNVADCDVSFGSVLSFLTRRAEKVP